ncbi:lysophospholipid acyltransferase family protein, partial [candidate division KSB1 bacterium]|nr:lysophospholipid acyltransferase family protein [candidate division KSB1 bacterium]
SWELMAAYVSQLGIPLAVVGKNLYDKRLDKLLIGWREDAGMQNIPRDGAARSMLQWLKKGGLIGVLIDQDTKVESEFAPFMGHPARTPLAPMLLAQRLGAPIVPMAIHLQENGKHVITVLPELDLIPDDKTGATRQKNLALCNRALEQLIAIDDRQWVWMHKRWKSQPKKKT